MARPKKSQPVTLKPVKLQRPVNCEADPDFVAPEMSSRERRVFGAIFNMLTRLHPTYAPRVVSRISVYATGVIKPDADPRPIDELLDTLPRTLDVLRRATPERFA